MLLIKFALIPGYTFSTATPLVSRFVVQSASLVDFSVMPRLCSPACVMVSKCNTAVQGFPLCLGKLAIGFAFGVVKAATLKALTLVTLVALYK